MSDAVSLDDYDGLLVAFGVDDATISMKLGMLGDLARAKWVAVAKKHLRSSLVPYEEGLQRAKLEGENVVVVLEGEFANMIEWGVPAFDLRQTILHSAKGKPPKVSAKGHLYKSIPFRHMGVKAGGRLSPALGSAYAATSAYTEAQARAFGREVQKEVRKLDVRERSPGNPKGASGQRLALDKAGQKLRGRHAAPLYAGMYRLGRPGHEGMMTFRTISDNPDTIREDLGGKNWWHPGLWPRRLHEFVLDYLERIGPSVFFGDPGAGVEGL